MNPVNKVLSLFGLRLSRENKTIKPRNKKEKEFREKYEYYFKQAENNKRGFKVLKDYRYQAGEHPFFRSDLQCEFVAYHLYNEKPVKVLDIGSWRHFIIGMLAHYDVTTIDFRNRKSILKNETILTCDAKELNIPSNSFDSVISLGSVYVFGLGRYGDEFDLDADIKALNHMIRVLKPGGLLIFSTSITAAQPTVLFNRTRIYNYEMIRGLCDGLDCVEEKFCGIRSNKASFLKLEELTTNPTAFDIYMGCWRKK